MNCFPDGHFLIVIYYGTQLLIHLIDRVECKKSIDREGCNDNCKDI